MRNVQEPPGGFTYTYLGWTPFLARAALISSSPRGLFRVAYLIPRFCAHPTQRSINLEIAAKVKKQSTRVVSRSAAYRGCVSH